MIRYFVLALAVSPLAVSPACPPPTGAFATFSPTSLSFAPQVVSPGDSPSASQMVTLKATGARNLSIANIEASGGFTQTNNCPTKPPPGGTCEIQVSFAPNSVGDISGAITLSSNAIGSPHIVNLSGTGLLPLGFSPAKLDFGSVSVHTTSSSKSVTLTNNETTALATIAF